MKRLISLALAAALAFSFVACGGSTSTSGQSTKDYAAIISSSRDQEMNDAFNIFTLKDGVFGSTGGYSEDLSEDEIKTQAELSLDMLGIEAEDVQDAAYSVSLMNVKAYGVAIVKPVSGKTEDVKQALSTFIEAQKSAQENYLADQYAIAKAAKLSVLKSGEVILVMCSGQDTVYNSIESALK